MAARALYLQRRDRNQSGVLERDEWNEVRSADQIDANGDGKLTRDELLSHFGQR